MYAWRCFVSWLKGEYPLAFTYWITGIFPSLLFAGGLYTLTYQLEHGTMAVDTGYAVVVGLTAISLIYTPFSLWATTASAINYRGFLLWKILAFLVVGKGTLTYFQTVFMIILEYL